MTNLEETYRRLARPWTREQLAPDTRQPITAERDRRKTANER